MAFFMKVLWVLSMIMVLGMIIGVIRDYRR